MIDEECCPGGSEECNYSEVHELGLAGAVLGAIEQFNKDRHVDPCPLCLRDAMLAMHLEVSGTRGAALGGLEALEEEFCEAARDKLSAVADAAAVGPIGLKQ